MIEHFISLNLFYSLLRIKVIIFYSIEPLQPAVLTEDDQASVITSTSQQVRYRADHEDDDGSSNPSSHA